MTALESAERLQTIAWGRSPHFFTLTSPDPAVCRHAATVFAPWMDGAAHAAAPERWLATPTGPGAWTLSTDGRDVPVRGDARRVVMFAESLAVQRILESPDTVTLHAALVARGGAGALILGPSESGKSTLSCGLWRRGWSLVGDDVAMIDAAAATATTAPRRVSLRHPSQRLLDADLWARMLAAPSTDETADSFLFHPSEVGHEAPRQVRLAAIVFLRRSGVPVPDAPRRLRHDAEAALALMPYSNQIRHRDAGAIVARLAPLVAQVPAWDVARGPLDDMAAAVAGLMEQGR